MKHSTFSVRLANRISRLLYVFIGVSGVLVATYLFNAIFDELNLTEAALQKQLKAEIKQIFNYGDIIQLQSALTLSARALDSSFTPYLVLKLKNVDKVLAYAGRPEATQNIFHRTTSESIDVPYYGSVQLLIDLGYDRKIAALALAMIVVLLAMIGLSWKIMQKVQQVIADQSLGLDDLELVLGEVETETTETKQFAKAAGLIRAFAETKAALVAAERTGMLAKQVAHDIRSPLSALNMVASTLDNIPTDRRNLINNSIMRINDIANDLLAKSRGQSRRMVGTDEEAVSNQVIRANAPEVGEVKAAVDFPKLVANIVAEKRVEFQRLNELEIETDFRNCSEARISIDSKAIARSISNLINNSIEALAESKGRVVVSIRGYPSRLSLTIQDNGKGIPSEVLSRLGAPGVSFGKEGSSSGSGLGVYAAKKTVEESKGKFGIQSKLGVGTSVEMIFPLVSN